MRKGKKLLVPPIMKPLVPWFQKQKKVLLEKLFDKHGRIGRSLEISYSSGNVGSSLMLNSFNDGEFSTIFCTEFLEHYLQPRIAVKEMRRLLSPEGILFLTTPHDTWFSLWKPLFALQNLLTIGKTKTGFVNRFSEKDVIALFKEAEFEPTEKTTWLFYINVFVFRKKFQPNRTIPPNLKVQRITTKKIIYTNQKTN